MRDSREVTLPPSGLPLKTDDAKFQAYRTSTGAVNHLPTCDFSLEPHPVVAKICMRR
jgi:hypothetical protein